MFPGPGDVGSMPLPTFLRAHGVAHGSVHTASECGIVKHCGREKIRGGMGWKLPRRGTRQVEEWSGNEVKQEEANGLEAGAGRWKGGRGGANKEHWGSIVERACRKNTELDACLHGPMKG